MWYDFKGIFKIMIAPHLWVFFLVEWWADIQLPANGVPNKPTPSSAQIRTNIIIMIAIKIFLYLWYLIFLIIIPSSSPVIESIIPIIKKSKKDQFISSVNCIAIIGIKSKSPTIGKILIIIFNKKYNICIIIPWFLYISSKFVGFFVYGNLGWVGLVFN